MYQINKYFRGKYNVKRNLVAASVVNKDLTLKAKAKDLTLKAKAKDLTLKAKAKDLTSEQVEGPL